MGLEIAWHLLGLILRGQQGAGAFEYHNKKDHRLHLEIVRTNIQDLFTKHQKGTKSASQSNPPNLSKGGIGITKRVILQC